MSFSKTSTFIFGLITCITSIGALCIALFKPSVDLIAYVDEPHTFYIPHQYIEKMTDLDTKASQSSLYEEIKKMDGETNFYSRWALSENLSKIFRPYFHLELNQFKSTIYFSVKNTGDAVAKDVYIELPENAILMVEEQSGNYQYPPSLLNKYKILSLRQNGEYRFWAWFKSGIDKIDQYGIKIGNDEQIAKIDYSQSYNGIQSLVAENYEFILAMLSLFIVFFFYMIYETFKSSDGDVEDVEEVSGNSP